MTQWLRLMQLTVRDEWDLQIKLRSLLRHPKRSLSTEGQRDGAKKISSAKLSDADRLHSKHWWRIQSGGWKAAKKTYWFHESIVGIPACWVTGGIPTGSTCVRLWKKNSVNKKKQPVRCAWANTPVSAVILLVSKYYWCVVLSQKRLQEKKNY